MKLWYCVYHHYIDEESPDGIAQIVASERERDATIYAHADTKNTMLFYRGNSRDWLAKYVCEADTNGRLIVEGEAGSHLSAYMQGDDWEGLRDAVVWDITLKESK